MQNGFWVRFKCLDFQVKFNFLCLAFCFLKFPDRETENEWMKMSISNTGMSPLKYRLTNIGSIPSRVIINVRNIWAIYYIVLYCKWGIGYNWVLALLWFWLNPESWNSVFSSGQWVKAVEHSPAWGFLSSNFKGLLSCSCLKCELPGPFCFTT